MSGKTGLVARRPGVVGQGAEWGTQRDLRSNPACVTMSCVASGFSSINPSLLLDLKIKDVI